jgi:tRNA(Ile2) C34 agmatinyltransferase TiaS
MIDRELSEGFQGTHIICPFCDSRMKAQPPGHVMRCRNCGEAFEAEHADEDFSGAESVFF